MKDLISIIIPVYNVEKYLSECIESVINQTYSELEIILIDDESTDNSGKICDEYAVKDARIKVIHQKNSGAASARNKGLRIATGEYLAFVDSDDYLEKDAYEYMVTQLNANHADVIQCAFRNVFVNRVVDCVMLPEFQEFSTKSFLRRFTIDWTSGLLWDKLYRRSLFENVYFEEGHKIDDEFFTYQGLMNAEKILHSPKVIYNYRKRRSGIMLNSAFQQQIVLDKLDYLSKRRIKIISRFPDIKTDFDLHFLNTLVMLSIDRAATVESIQQTQKLLRDYSKERGHCKIGISLRKRLFFLQHQKPESIFTQKETETKTINFDTNEYFE